MERNALLCKSYNQQLHRRKMIPLYSHVLVYLEQSFCMIRSRKPTVKCITITNWGKQSAMLHGTPFRLLLYFTVTCVCAIHGLSCCDSFSLAASNASLLQHVLLARQLSQPSQHLPLKGLTQQQQSQVLNQYNHEQQRGVPLPSMVSSPQPCPRPLCYFWAVHTQLGF